MIRMTGGRAVVEQLRVEGVEQVFGIVGTHNAHLFDGLFDEPRLRLVTPRHEQGGALMALGYARASGNIAACFTVPGPGLTNALTGLGMAYAESTPLLLVAGQNPVGVLERGLEEFHELRGSLQVAASVADYVARVTRPADVPHVVHQALRALRLRRPRPAYVEVPMDVLAAEMDVELWPAEPVSRPGGDPASVARAAKLLTESDRPIILAGGGAVSAAADDALRHLAEVLGAPVITSLSGKGILPEDHPLALGDGWIRLPLYDEVFDRADLALVVGTRLGYLTDAAYGARLPRRIVQVDLDPLVIGQRRSVDLGIVGDAAAVLEALAQQVPERGARWFDSDAFIRRKRDWLAERSGPVFQVLSDLRAALPRDAILVDDLTLVGYWAPVLFDVYRSRSLIHAGSYGTLGYALPVAIGARMACPERPVVSISGDGGFLYTVQELATARAERLDLVALVFNDHAYGALRTFQDRHFGGRRVGSDLVNPDFVRLAEAFDIRAERVQPQDIGPTVQRALAAGGTWLIEVPFAPGSPAAVPPWMA